MQDDATEPREGRTASESINLETDPSSSHVSQDRKVLFCKRLSNEDLVRRCLISAATARRAFPSVHDAAPGDVVIRIRVVDMRGTIWYAHVQKDNKSTYFKIVGDVEDSKVQHREVMQRRWRLEQGDLLMLTAHRSQRSGGKGTFHVEWNSPMALSNVENRCTKLALCPLPNDHQGECRALQSHVEAEEGRQPIHHEERNTLEELEESSWAPSFRNVIALLAKDSLRKSQRDNDPK